MTMLRRLLIFLIFACAGNAARAACGGNFEDVFALLNLDRPGLEQVRADCRNRQWKKASEALLEYYRHRDGVYIPGQDSRDASAEDMTWADDALQHTFHVLENPVWNYGKDIDWEYWPEKDIEMRVQLHRQGWWAPLGRAFNTTGDEKYAREYVSEFRDWVVKNPYKPFGIDDRGTVSSGSIDINAPNECFAWRPLEVGIRLLRWCTHFSLFLESRCYTPDFLLEFLRAYHHNADVLMHSFSPAGNHLIHQSQGIIRAGICFPEFKDSESWIRAGVNNLTRETDRQSYPDGCHFELDPGYHIGFVESYNSAVQVALKNGRETLLPPECLERLVRMTAYYLDYRYPDGTHPCFSDARRYDDLADADLLLDVSGYSDSPQTRLIRWFATDGREGTPPQYKSSGYPDTGFYTFRSGWGSDSIIMPVKATERGMWHAQPDFGTFELWAYGRKLMPDAGSYTYSGDEEIERERAYFKQTARHNAVTLSDGNYDDPHPQLLTWRPDADSAGVQVLSVRHEAYDGLNRRRSIAFVNDSFFVVMDDVTGPASGQLTLRNGLGPGTVTPVPAESSAAADSSLIIASSSLTRAGDFVYRDGDAGLRITVFGPEGSAAAIDQDWFSEAIHCRSLRPVVRLDACRNPGEGPQSFVTVLYPFRGGDAPDININEISKILRPIL